VESLFFGVWRANKKGKKQINASFPLVSFILNPIENPIENS
jgi:hypothetical protein